MIDTAFLIRTLGDLVKINSINPALEDGGPGEIEIATYIHSILQSLDIESHIDVLAPTRANVIGKIPGSGKGKSLMLNAHMDTVGVKGMDNPFSGEVKDGKLYGRGAYDMKASIGAMLAAAKAIKEDGTRTGGDILLTFVADEEFDSIGSEDIVRKYKTDGCIVTEPTELQICLGHRGFGIYELKTKGVIAHGGKHLEGVDANIKMGKVLIAINQLSEKLANKKPHPLLGSGSIHVPLINGGQSLFIYSGECTIQIERRTLPGETPESCLQQLQDLIDQLSSQDPQFHSSVKQLMWRNPCEVAKDSAIVQSMITAMDANKFPVEFIGHTWWEDSGLFSEAGIETVIMGPTGGGPHQHVEWVEIESVERLAIILVNTAREYTNPGG